MDIIDKTILNRIQSDFPISSYPFKMIAEELDLTEDEIIKRITQLRKTGIIRRIGGNFFPEKLGYVSTLCAAKVPADKIDFFAETVNAYPGVTHNYQRDNDFNVWFTFICPSMEQIELNLKRIAEVTGVNSIISLPATKVFKLKAHFNLETKA